MQRTLLGCAALEKWLRFDVREVIAILLTVETGTVLVDAFEFTVALDLGIGIGGLERVE